ncbi:MAG: VWA domain-containing protein [Fibrobacter sp.]|nr:VWA domain-containing protein [Fibrobacter sp.]
MLRWTTLFVVFFTFLANAAVEHGTTFPITETAQTYSANDNYYDSDRPGIIRFSYTPTKTGRCSISSSYTTSSFYRYLYYYGTNDSFSSYVDYTYGYYTLDFPFICTAGETYYFTVSVSSSSYYSYYFDIQAEGNIVPTYKVNADTLGSGYVYVGTYSRNYDSTYTANDAVPIRAYTRANTRFKNWEKVSGSCSITNEKSAQTTVVIQGDCKVRAVFEEAIVYPITKTEKKYNLLEHYYSGAPYNGVRFSFVAPKDGGYVINYKKDSTEYSYIQRYRTSAFSSYDFYRYVQDSLSDTLALMAGDSVFYLVTSDYSRDSLMSFSMSYDTVPTFRLTVESASPECSTSVSSQVYVKNAVAYIEAVANNGYRPDGWTFVSGSHKFSDSTAFSIRDTIVSDTKIRLNCREAKLIDVTDKPKTYVPNNDFYETSPNSGMRFRYEAPTSGIYVLRYQPNGLHGTYRYHENDSTFRTSKRSLNTSVKTSFNLVASSDGERFYSSVIPYSIGYWDDSVSVVALPAGTVRIDGQTAIDTLARGDTLMVTAPLDSGAHLKNWTIVSGKGSFIDGSLRSTGFILEESAVIKPVTSTLPLYELTQNYKGFTFKDNSTQSNSRIYGIRAYFDAAADELYVLQLKTDNSTYIYNYTTDSTFFSYSSYLCNNAKNCRYSLSYTTDGKRYFQFTPYSIANSSDSIWVRVVKRVKLRTDTSGIGYAYVGSNNRNYDSTYIAGDTVLIRAMTSTVGSKFNKWSVVSGSCKIIDSTKASTYVVPNGDCTVKAHFVAGTVYKITDVATKYTPVDNYYSISPTNGVRFSFAAPTSGSYTFVFTSVDMPMVIERYSTSAFSSYVTRTTGVRSRFDPLTLSAGDSVFYIVRTYNSVDTTKSFWVSYSQSKIGIKLTTDGHGKALPDTGYSSAWSGAAYPITAEADSGYRFDQWTFDSGKGTIDDPNSIKTVVFAAESVTVKATFRPGDIFELTTKEDIYNFQRHYFSETEKGTVFFSWTPSDTSHYLLKLDSVKGSCTYYGLDSLFSAAGTTYKLEGGVTYIPLKGTPGKTYYLSVSDSLKTVARDKNFTTQLIVPKVMYVESTRGRTVPEDYVYVAPGLDTAVYAVPYGGFIFDSWSLVSGTAKIDNPQSSSIRVEPQSDFCHIRANYVFDSTTVPELKVTNLDLSNYPGICTQVSVVDKRNGKPIVGLDSSDFALFQDSTSVSAQATTILSYTGVSVALVVDESGSMATNDRIGEAKKAIRQFINEMGPYDRTAIVGFNGGTSVKVHQTMTSDRYLLLAAVDSLKASGTTNICTGAKLGVEQVIGETNPTAVIVFSDGINMSESVSAAQVADLSKSLGTNVHTIAVETTTNSTLQELADATGGTYTEAPSASQLTGIYTSIRSVVQSRYVLCYQSPDTVWNGDTHLVEVTTKFLDKTASDTVSWDEGNPPPVVELTPSTWNLVGVEQPQNKSLTIDVYVYSKTGITDVKLYTRDVNLSNGSFKSYKMTQENDSLWRYVIPDSMVRYPGIDFYVVATDSNSLTGKTPAVANPSKEPYTIPVKNDVPVVKMDSLACVDTVGGHGVLRFKISDDDKIDHATFFYKDTMAVLFDELMMTEANGYWIASVPSKAFERNIIEFYVRAVDGVGASARWLAKQNTRIAACAPKVITDIPDIIKIVNADNAQEKIVYETEKLNLTLVSEDFTEAVDTVQAKLSCLISGDVERNINLVEKRAGYYENIDPIVKNGETALKGDGEISCEIHDILVAEYMDPLYGTYARDTVYIDFSVVDVPDTIRIVNADSTQEKIVIETDKLNLTLVTEDFSNKIDTVRAKLSCLISGDVEKNINLVEKSSGYYETPSPISKDENPAVRDDGTISCLGRDTLVAEYVDPIYGTYARDTVFIDFSVEDVPDTIKIVNDDPAQISIDRETEKLKLTLVTEDFTKSTDTVKVRLSCLVSGDVENNINLVEKKSGYYETRKAILKNEYDAKVDDGAISCTGRDTLVAEYKDPLYGTYARDTVAIIRDSIDFGYRFLDKDGKKDLDSVETGDSAKFRIRLTAYSNSIHVKDTLNVLLLTNKGDSLWVKAIETDVYSSTFEYKGTFFFAYEKSELESSRLDALFDMESTYNRVIITAKVKGDNLGKKRDSLVVFSNYIPADYAEIYDADKDGKADSIRVHYVAKNKDGIEGIDTLYWNKAGGTWRSIAKKKFREVSKGSWFEANVKDPFDYGATALDANEPYLRLTKPKGGFSQKVKIKDKVGAVPVKAVKRPGMISIEAYMECSNDVPPDTLEITLSEPVKNTGKDESGKKAAWRKLFTYSADCKDTNENSLNITELIKKDSAGLVWSFVLGDHIIMTDHCIRTNPKSSYVDGQKNSMGRGGVEIEGNNGNMYLYEVVATPAVSGIGSKAEWIAPKKHEWSRVPDTLSVIRVASIMPYKAYVNIYDGYSNVVASFTREFGDKGEMKEKIRGNDENHAKVGFLHWDNRSDEGRKVGTGVYIWRIEFKFKDGHSESRLVKTGVKRKK